MSHNHHEKFSDYNRSFAIGVVLNIIFVAIEAGYGLLADSMALIADAGHNLSDVVSLLLAWGASLLAAKAATDKRTYGFRKVTVMASLISGILLLVALGSIAWESFGRIFAPQPVQGVTVIVVAAIGVVINTITALLFVKGQKDDLNIRGAFLHMTADAGVSFGVVIAGVCILFTEWTWIDPAVSLIIVGVIFVGTWGLLRDSMNFALDAVPGSVDLVGVRRYLEGLDRVGRIHDLHVWPLSTTETALTVHLVVRDDVLDNTFLRDIQEHLQRHFDIDHTTVQIEKMTAEDDCVLENDKCEKE